MYGRCSFGRPRGLGAGGLQKLCKRFPTVPFLPVVAQLVLPVLVLRSEVDVGRGHSGVPELGVDGRARHLVTVHPARGFPAQIVEVQILDLGPATGRAQDVLTLSICSPTSLPNT